MPIVDYTRKPEEIAGLYREAVRRIGDAARGRDGGASARRCRGATRASSPRSSSVEGYNKAAGEDDPRAQFRTVTPNYFATLGVPIVAGRDFNEADRRGEERVVIVSQSLAERMFPGQDAVNRRFQWTDPVIKFIDVSGDMRRIVGVAADVDDENIVPQPRMTVYHPLEQEMGGGRLFVKTSVDPYSLVPAVTRTMRELSADQPVERAATLDDVRAEVLSPNRLSALVFGGFASVALLIAVVGVAGVLAFSVSARTREFGVRLAIGSAPRHLLTGRAARRRRDRRRRDPDRRHQRRRAGARRRQLHRRRRGARHPADAAGGGAAHRGGRPGVVHPGRAGGAGRRHAGVAVRVVRAWRPAERYAFPPAPLSNSRSAASQSSTGLPGRPLRSRCR